MKTKALAILFVFLIGIFTASAQWIQPLNCPKLFSGEFFPQEEYDEIASICFYGSGITGPADIKLVSLSDESQTKVIEGVTVSNGVVSSLNDDYFSNVRSGEYELVVSAANGEIAYSENIMVNGEFNGEIPEFSLVSAVLIIAGALGFIMLRRRG